MTGRLRVRLVLQTFEVRKLTEDNAIEIAEWLRDSGDELNVPHHRQPLVSFAGPKPVLATNWEFAQGIRPGAWVGWGFPQIVPEGDIPLAQFVVLDETYIESDRTDQGIEVVQ